MKKIKFIDAVLAERLFIIAIALLALLLLANFIFVTRLITAQSRQTDHVKIEAEVSTNDIKTIESASKKIAKDPDAVKRAESVVAESQLYQYQDQIINDLQGYAGRSGIQITGYSFSATDSAAAGPAAPAPAAGAGGAAAATSPKLAAPAGVSSTNVSVTLGQKVGYVNFLNFLKLIENNVTRMQITNVSLTPDIENRATLSSPTLSIMVYTR